MGRVLGGAGWQCHQAARGTAASAGFWGAKAAALLEVEAGTLGVVTFKKADPGGEP